MESFNGDTVVIVNNFNLTQIYLRFNVVAYALFILSLYASYFLFRLILGRVFDYERHKKTPSQHYHHLVDTFIYGTVLFIFGNYSQCFSWITSLCIIIGLFGFAWIAELPFAKVSLQSLKTWDIKLKIITLVGVAIILAASGYHFYLATQFKIDEDASLIFPYLLALFLICLFIFLSTIIVYKYQNMAFPNLKRRIIKVGERRRHHIMTRNELDEYNNRAISRAVEENQEVAEPEIKFEDVILIDMPRVGFHLHHWQIFYYLAFFTRFDNPISQICAGLVIGIFMHGVAAYGFHDLLEE